MFNDKLIIDGSTRNVADAAGAVTGFAFDTAIAYYRGLGLSMVEVPDVAVDGEAVPAEDLRFTCRGVTRTFDELKDVSDVRWELGETATITVVRPGGAWPPASTS